MLQICEAGMIFGLRRDGRIRWSMSIWRRFLQPGTVWTHAAWSLRKSQLHSSSFCSHFHFYPPSFRFFFWTVHYGTLALQGGWCSLELHNSHVSHSSHVSPISYTPQEGWTDGEKEGESEKREKGGGGGEWGIWYALCMSDLYKTKPECICVYVYMLGKSKSVYIKLHKGVAKKAYNLFPDFFFA